jgi:hypothetical protein
MRYLILLLVLLTLTPAEALTKRACRAACATNIAACTALYGRPRACARLLVKRCRRQGFAACPDLTPTSVPTTTTSTTIPAPLNVTGTWTFTGSLSLNDCFLTADPTFVSVLHITQTGTTLSGTIGVVNASGSVDYAAGEWDFTSAVQCDAVTGCCAIGGVATLAPLGNPARAVLVITTSCGGGACGVGYSGTVAQ